MPKMNRPETRKQNPGVQGEGDYISGRAYQKEAKRFAQEHDTAQLARDAAPKDEVERLELAEAERKGKARARGKKPPRQ